MFWGNQKGFSLVEMVLAAGLWFVMIAGVSSALIQAKRQQTFTETQDVAELFGVTLSKYYLNPDTCSANVVGSIIRFNTKKNLSVPNFPFQTISGGVTNNTVTLAAGARLLGDRITVKNLTIELKYPNADNAPGAVGAVRIWYSGALHWRNTALVTAQYDLKVGDVIKPDRFKTVEIPVIVNAATSVVSSCTEDPGTEEACGVIFSSQALPTTNCNPVRIEFKGTYHTREVIGSPPTVACPSPVVKTANIAMPGYCPPGRFWSKDLPPPTPAQCIPQGICLPGQGEFSGVCYPVALPQGTCPAGQGDYMGTCMDTSVIDQATYICTCPDNGAIVNCGQRPGVPTAPCADANTMAVDPTSGAYLCACPAGSTEFMSGQHDWTQTTSVLCGWSGYGKKVGPSYCPVTTGMRDKFYVCIKTS